MDGDAAGPEFECACGIALGRSSRGKIAVFDDGHFSVDLRKDADALGGIGLAYDLGRHL